MLRPGMNPKSPKEAWKMKSADDAGAGEPRFGREADSERGGGRPSSRSPGRWNRNPISSALICVICGSILLGVTVAHPSEASPEGPWRLALPGYRYRFPRDHAAHPEFRTEWWYYTGHLRTKEGARYGFELTFFRVGMRRTAASRSAWALRDLYFAHFTVTDEEGRRFFVTDKINRGALGMAGARTDRCRVWIDTWQVELENGIFHLHADHPEWAIDLRLRSAKPPVLQGVNGVSQKAPGRGRASHYYSLTRLTGAGSLRVGSEELLVEALAWMDHEFGSNQLTPEQVGWDWYSLQLDDGRELMLYVMRLRDGRVERVSSGTAVAIDGRSRHLRLAGFHIEATGRWRSPTTGGVYPAGWRIQVPSENLDVTVLPTVSQQEVITRGGAGVSYWEGSVRVTGSATGVGYVELTGYARGSSPGI
jgi:predicted secreted hydrolase